MRDTLLKQDHTLETRQSNRYLYLFLGLSTIIVAADQLLKYLVLKLQPNIDWKFLAFHLVKNTGAGFGLLKGQQLLLAIISSVVVLVIVVYYKKIPQERFPQLLFALLLGGTFGNLIDRALRQYVIDFIDFKFWPVFNLADACISLASIGLIIYFWKEK